MENAYPRVYSTNKLSKRGLANMYGPFPSRLAAERYCDAVLDLFKLRRCYEDLAALPRASRLRLRGDEEVHRALQPSLHPEEYAAEAAAVKKFFDTRGESMIIDIGLEREEAFRRHALREAAALHAQWQKVKAVKPSPTGLVRPVPNSAPCIVQAAAPDEDRPEEA